MNTPLDPRQTVCDTSVVINFLIAQRIDLLVGNPEYRFVLTEHVRAEVTSASQAPVLDKAISTGGLVEVALDDPGALEIYAKLSSVLGRGESAAIALAACRGWLVAMDERGRARRELERHLGTGRLVTTPGILVGCIRSRMLSVAEADGIKAVLAANRFAMSFKSFADVVPLEGAG